MGGTLSADWALPRSLLYLIMDDCNLTGSLPNGWDLPRLEVSGSGGVGALTAPQASLPPLLAARRVPSI